jgi:hypothetical protein
MKTLNKNISEFYRSNSYVGFYLFAIFSVIFLLLEIYNGRFWQSDFSVYYKAAQRLFDGNNLYQYAEDGHYVFKYSPVSAVFFIPFLIFSLSTAKVIYWFFLTGFIAGGFYISIYLASKEGLLKNPARMNNIILLGLLILVVHFQRELHLGQVNQILLVMYLIAAYFYGKEKVIFSSLLIAASIFIKPFGLIFIPYLIVKGKYKDTVYLIIFGALFFLLPLLFYSFDEFINQNMLWINELAVELGNKQNLVQSANHTIFSIFVRHTPLGMLSFTPYLVKIYQITILGIIGILTLVFIYKGKNIKSNYVSEFALLISFIPLLSFTSQNAFGFAGLLVFILLINFRTFSIAEKVITIIGFIFLGGNYNDIWGSGLSSFFNDISLVSIGTLLLIFILFKKRFQKLV